MCHTATIWFIKLNKKLIKLIIIKKKKLTSIILNLSIWLNRSKFKFELKIKIGFSSIQLPNLKYFLGIPKRSMISVIILCNNILEKLRIFGHFRFGSKFNFIDPKQGQKVKPWPLFTHSCNLTNNT